MSLQDWLILSLAVFAIFDRINIYRLTRRNRRIEELEKRK